jgi:hypothetical protein
MMTCHELLGFMSPPLANEILEFAHENDKNLYKATMASVAESLKLRPIFFERKSRADRHAAMLGMLTRPRFEAVAANLIRGWLVQGQSGMLSDFLDALGVPHQKGVVEAFPEKVDDAKLNQAVEALLAKHTPERVVVYLNAFCSMNEVGWPNLEKMLDTDPRLQLA